MKSIRNKPKRGHRRNKKSYTIAQRMFLFSPKAPNIAVKIKKNKVY